jgi:hypothetical protein
MDGLLPLQGYRSHYRLSISPHRPALQALYTPRGITLPPATLL